MITVFLGAGFSYLGGVPLAGQLFDHEPEVDRITRQQLVERVLENWRRWQRKTEGQPEEYLAFVQQDGGRRWLDATWYVGLVIALKMGKVEYVGVNRTITRHNLNRTSGIDVHEVFWSTIFRRTSEVAVITTNYDILAERGLRHEPRPRALRSGFHYGDGSERLAGGGYPSYAHIQKITVSGTIPLLKLHSSISWSFREGNIIRYHDCRPAIRGDAAIVAPVVAKALPKYLKCIWASAGEALRSSATWIVVGYSLPKYDLLVRELLANNSVEGPRVHVFDPNPEIAVRYRSLLTTAKIQSHPGLPEGVSDLQTILASACNHRGVG